MPETRSQFERHLLLNIPLPECEDIKLSSFIQEILNGSFEVVIGSNFFSDNIVPLAIECIESSIEEKIYANKDDHEKWFYLGIASLLLFIENNFNGISKIEENKDKIWCIGSLRNIVITKLSLQDQCNENVVKPELLLLARAILHNKELTESFPSSLWWSLRVNYVHQLILDEVSGTLFEESENLIKLVLESDILNETILETLFLTEVTHMYLYYTRIQSSEKYLKDAQSLAKLTVELKGALGKRTKHQQDEKAQLYLKVEIDKEVFSYRTCEDLPKVVNLSDDVRLERVEFSKEREPKQKLGGIEEAIIFAKFFQLQLSQPKDQLTDEELVTYLEYIIDNTEIWALKMSALFQRSVLECKHKRTIERALAQTEYLITKVKINEDLQPEPFKFDLFFASGMKPIWDMKKHLADLMLNLGMVKGALEIYLNLSLWEDVIVCYTILNLKHKAAEIIKQELAKQPSVKLWCLLGDAEQNVEHYETAWKLSGEKSSRAQRHWGFHYYIKQDYTKALPHLKLSAKLNTIQENVLIRLGFAALQLEDWKLAASAYRKYCSLEQSNFEVWNNLAKAYIKLGDKPRAWRSLQDAIKCNFDKWEVWDNLMIVSSDLGHFSEVIRCYHRILDIKGSHVDVQILAILSRAIVNEIEDSEGNSSRKYLPKTLELFGRLTSITSTNPDIWRLYAELTSLRNGDLDFQKVTQYLQKAYRSSVADPRWFRTVEGVNKVLDTCVRLTEASMIYLEKCHIAHRKLVLHNPKAIIQSVITKMRDLNWDDQSGIIENLNKVEMCQKDILDALEKLNNAENK